MSNLFYVVEKDSKDSNLKEIRVYEIALDFPKLWFKLKVKNDKPDEEEIRNFLSNGFETRTYKFIRL